MGLYISANGILNALHRNDITANNVANSRTPGYRAARADSVETPEGGARVASVSRSNAQGPIETTGRPLDVSSSTGFFRVQQPDGSTAYTRDGSFGLNAEGEVVTGNGSRLDPPVQVPANATSVNVTRDGAVLATVPGNVAPREVGRLEVFQFQNPGGLEALGGNLYAPTPASGTAAAVASPQAEFYPGTLQGSNVNMTLEMVSQVLDTHTLAANVNAFRAQEDVLGELLDLTS